MIVTKSNFTEAKKKFLQLLPNAAFVTLDEEMTGIGSRGNVNDSVQG